MKGHEKKIGIGRRQALGRLAAGAGATAASPFLKGAAVRAKENMPVMPSPRDSSLGSAEAPDPSLTARDWKPKFFDQHENETVIALSDLIIPDTDTPGAKAAQVNRFIDLFLSASDPETQKRYLQALGWLDGHCLSIYSRPFTRLTPNDQSEVLKLLTHNNSDPQIAHGVELFRVVKGSVVEAYYSSEIGSLRELKYETNPFQAEYPGCKNPEEH